MKRLLLLSLPTALLLAGTAQASFTQEIGSPVGVDTAPYDVVAADLDRDGRPDLATANGTAGTISVLLRQAGGGFQPEGPSIPAGSGTTTLAVADFNSDTRLDLASANYANPGGTGTVFLRNPLTSFSQEGSAYSIPAANSVAAGDFNGDAQPDIAWGSGLTDAIYVYLRNAGTEFTKEGTEITTPGHKTGLVTGDFNGDGRLDLASANDSAGTVSVLLRQGGGGFSVGAPIPVGLTPKRLATGDFNRDGRTDLAVTLFGSDAVALLLGQPGGSFAAPSTHGVGDGPTGIATGDFNRDGALDLAVANQAGSNVSVLLRAGSGFSPDPSSPIPTGQLGATGIAAADYDGDARTDLAVSNSGSDSVTVLLNTTPAPPGPGPVDADGDGVSPPADCNDTNPNVRPGARDKPRDKIDQDCNGRDARYRPVSRKVRFKQRTSASGTVFTLVEVAPVKRGDRVKLTCKGRGCPLRAKTTKVKKSKKSLSLTRRLKGAKLRKGAVLEVRVTRRGAVGLAKHWKVRAPKQPALTSKCLPPGKTKPVTC